jgi:hypothetical protein
MNRPIRIMAGGTGGHNVGCVIKRVVHAVATTGKVTDIGECHV